jgi:hypothetical protein
VKKRLVDSGELTEGVGLEIDLDEPPVASAPEERRPELLRHDATGEDPELGRRLLQLAGATPD